MDLQISRQSSLYRLLKSSKKKENLKALQALTPADLKTPCDGLLTCLTNDVLTSDSTEVRNEAFQLLYNFFHSFSESLVNRPGAWQLNLHSWQTVCNAIVTEVNGSETDGSLYCLILLLDTLLVASPEYLYSFFLLRDEAIGDPYRALSTAALGSIGGKEAGADVGSGQQQTLLPQGLCVPALERMARLLPRLWRCFCLADTDSNLARDPSVSRQALRLLPDHLEQYADSYSYSGCYCRRRA